MLEFDPSKIKVPFIPIDKIWQKADEFRDAYWKSMKLPIDIEEIIEKKLNLHIIPESGLKKYHDTDAFLSLDCTSIFVDLQDFMDDRMENRLRFSLAHEIGHYILHRNVYATYSEQISSEKELIEFHKVISDRDYEFIEWQASEFAGRLLVPKNLLAEHFNKTIKMINDKQGGNLYEFVKDYISSNICRKFGVSDQVINIRLDRENLWPPSQIK